MTPLSPDGEISCLAVMYTPTLALLKPARPHCAPYWTCPDTSTLWTMTSAPPKPHRLPRRARFTYTYEAVCRVCGAVVVSRHYDGFYQHQVDCSRHQNRRLRDLYDPYSSDDGFEYEGMNNVPRWSPSSPGKRRRLNPDDEDSDVDPPSLPHTTDIPPHCHVKTGRGEDLLTTHLEPNPGPPVSRPYSGPSPARGSDLLSCGDVEPNPGPPKTKARRTDDMVIDLAVPPATDSAGMPYPYPRNLYRPWTRIHNPTLPHLGHQPRIQDPRQPLTTLDGDLKGKWAERVGFQVQNSLFFSMVLARSLRVQICIPACH